MELATGGRDGRKALQIHSACVHNAILWRVQYLVFCLDTASAQSQLFCIQSKMESWRDFLEHTFKYALWLLFVSVSVFVLRT